MDDPADPFPERGPGDPEARIGVLRVDRRLRRAFDEARPRAFAKSLEQFGIPFAAADKGKVHENQRGESGLVPHTSDDPNRLAHFMGLRWGCQGWYRIVYR